MLTLALIAIPALTETAQAGGMEHHGNMHKMIQQADSNHDGKVTKAEFRAAVIKHAEKRFSHMDANHDGVLDDKDHQAHADNHFNAMDADHNGTISRKEFNQFHQKMRAKHHQGEHHHE